MSPCRALEGWGGTPRAPHARDRWGGFSEVRHASRARFREGQ